METANVLLALGGDKRNSVPKYNVTAAEVAVMREIHGHDAVYDIEVVGTVQRTHRQEIGRLAERYGRQDGERRISPAVNALYPGAAARVHETFVELELPDEFFVATGRKVARQAEGDAPQKPAPDAPTASAPSLSSLKVIELQALAAKEGVDLTGITRKDDIIEAIELKREADAQDDDDEQDGDNTSDMDDDISKSGDGMFN